DIIASRDQKSASRDLDEIRIECANVCRRRLVASFNVLDKGEKQILGNLRTGVFWRYRNHRSHYFLRYPSVQSDAKFSSESLKINPRSFSRFGEPGRASVFDNNSFARVRLIGIQKPRKDLRKHR